VPQLDLVAQHVDWHGRRFWKSKRQFANGRRRWRNLTDRLKASGDTQSFSVSIRQVNPGPPQPQLNLYSRSLAPSPSKY
jgi:hypothetical protein